MERGQTVYLRIPLNPVKPILKLRRMEGENLKPQIARMTQIEQKPTV